MCVRTKLSYIAFLLLGAWAGLATATESAERVFLNGVIYGEPRAEAVALAGGRILAVGTDEQISAYITEQSRVVDLDGRLVLPGFIDNHNHAGEGGEVGCFPDSAGGLEHNYDLLSECAQDASKGEWVIGYGMTLEQVLAEETEGSSPVAYLDELFPDNPVIIMEHSSHAMFVNSLAYARAGIHRESPDPQGGKLMRDAQGRLNGVLVDNAGDVVMELAVNALPDKQERLYDGVLAGLEALRKNGITTMGDGRTYWRRGMLEAWQQVERSGELTARVSIRPWIYPGLDRQTQLAYLSKVYQPDVSKLLIVNQVKMYIDGVPENGTAKLLEPYADTYFPESPIGINYIPARGMPLWLSDLARIGYGAHIHALGDRGVRESLDAIAYVRKQGSRKTYNMTHLSMVDPADVRRFAKLGVDADIQLGEACATHEERSHTFTGLIERSRANKLFYRPIKELWQSDANVVLSSDWTVHDLNPLAAISLAVEEGSLSLPQAIDTYTINAAKALGLEQLTGSIAVGKSADLVVLDRNILKLSPRELKKARVDMTLLEGELIYSGRVVQR